MIFSYVPLYNILFSVQQTCQAWNDLCFHHYLWREVHYSKEFDERLTKKKLLSVLKQVSSGVKHISFEKAFQSRENHFSFNKFLRCILHENVDMGNIASLKIPSIPYKYLEPLVKKCSGLSSIEIGYKYAYYNDGIFFDTLKRLPNLKEFRISKSAGFVPLNVDEDFTSSQLQTMFNEFLADMFSSLLELEVVHIDSANKLYDSTLCVLLSKCKNLRELALYECICITNAGLDSLPDKSGITSLHLISAGISDDGMMQIMSWSSWSLICRVYVCHRHFNRPFMYRLSEPRIPHCIGSRHRLPQIKHNGRRSGDIIPALPISAFTHVV